MKRIDKTMQRPSTAKVVVTTISSERPQNLARARHFPPHSTDQNVLTGRNYPATATRPYSVSYKKHCLRLVISALLVGLPLLAHQAYAADISFNNEPGKLRNDPILGNPGSLFPSTNLSNNKVVVLAGSISGYVFGGVTYDGYEAVYGNSVAVVGGAVGKDVYGGYSNYGNSMNNHALISGGAVGENVVGGYSFFGVATGNTVTLSSGTIGGSVKGGESYSGSAINNVVNILGIPSFNAINTSLYGGFVTAGNGDVFTGNTLIFSAHPVTVNSVANFERYRFVINPAYANNGTALLAADTITLGDGSGRSSIFEVIGILSGNVLNAGDEFILMKANNMPGDGLSSIGTAQQGISLLYDVQTEVDSGGQLVRTTILAGNGGPRVNPQLKALSEGYLAGSQMVIRGADLIADSVFTTIDAQNGRNGWAPFVVLSGQHNRYNSGSYIKSNDFLLTGGLSYQQNNLTAGAFLETGWGDYDSYNSFDNATSVKGDGNDHYYGLGLLARYDLTNAFYTDASVRLGLNRNNFDTRDIQNIATGQFASYKVTSSYVSAHTGVGYILSIDKKNQLDLSAKYLWTSLGGKEVNVAGDTVHFDRINSSRIRLSNELNHYYSDTLTVNVGLGYEYEFDSKAKVTTYDIYRIDAPSVKGDTGILSLGASMKPASQQNLKLDFRVNGYTGKREGVSGNIGVNYTF